MIWRTHKVFRVFSVKFSLCMSLHTVPVLWRFLMSFAPICHGMPLNSLSPGLHLHWFYSWYDELSDERWFWQRVMQTIQVRVGITERRLSRVMKIWRQRSFLSILHLWFCCDVTFLHLCFPSMFPSDSNCDSFCVIFFCSVHFHSISIVQMKGWKHTLVLLQMF